MAAHGGNGEPTVGSGEPRQKGRATPETIRIGCIAMVNKEGVPRRAEILSIKETKSGRQFYCNFDNFNKRLDEWVPTSRIDFEQDVEWPNPEKDKPKDAKSKKGTATSKKQVSKKSQKRPAKREQSAPSETATPHPWSEFVESQSRKMTPTAEESQAQTPATGEASATPAAAGDEMDIDGEEVDQKKDLNGFSREEEIEKLRTHGSMTQNPAEISRIRNISKVQFGKNDLFPWYFSPYPEAFNQEDVIYICEFCLGYYGDEKAFSRHRRKCTLQHPPGNEIYRDDSVSFFEIDGRRQRTYCRNLCLLSKMFLDHKTLYYDVDPFLFYVMASRDAKGCHIIGYFSKEKESADGYNVACILTLPQYQRKGYGRLLIQFSYELSKIEGKLGSPEKPLSDLGLLSYRQYWGENILDLLVGYNEREEKATIEAISSQLAIIPQDVEHTLQALKMQVYHKGEHKIVIPEKLIQQREKQKVKQKRLIDPAKIQWKPPVFTASTRTWGCRSRSPELQLNTTSRDMINCRTGCPIREILRSTFLPQSPRKKVMNRSVARLSIARTLTQLPHPPRPLTRIAPPRAGTATGTHTSRPATTTADARRQPFSTLSPRSAKMNVPRRKKPINLLRGWPAPSLLPAQALSQAAVTALADPATYVPGLQYGPDPGYQPLREAAAKWLAEFYPRASPAYESSTSVNEDHHDPDVSRICVTGGASQNLACILQSFTDPLYTQNVWMVAPCYFLACPIFADAGFDGRLRAVPEDEEGIDIEYLRRGLEAAEGKGSEERLKQAKNRKLYRHVIYLVPTCSNPTGKTMSLRRRYELVALARKHDALLVTDDVYDMLQWPVANNSTDASTLSGYYSQSMRLPRLVDIDRAMGVPESSFGNAVSNGSFSKIVGPGMRTGWAEASPAFAYGLSQTGSTCSGGAPSQFSAMVVAEYMRQGELRRQLDEVTRPALARRHALMMRALREHVQGPLGEGVVLREVALKGEEHYGGYFVWFSLPEGMSSREAAVRAKDTEDLVIGHGGQFEVHGDEETARFGREIRLCFSWEPEEDIVEGVERLGRVLKAMKEGGEWKSTIALDVDNVK
ncbi:histone acetyltransferase esa1 [Colletotrichum sojae]|uniref:Histone acetyltransferase ESA1 n=1 Tax=Colletotrichum sojae TaxID=2175907 RepID=A0A8H6MQQ1_9PEZI|nr:histone acetyltransferase esa1 [Colletotrichum sojae]